MTEEHARIIANYIVNQLKDDGLINPDTSLDANAQRAEDLTTERLTFAMTSVYKSLHNKYIKAVCEMPALRAQLDEVSELRLEEKIELEREIDRLHDEILKIK